MHTQNTKNATGGGVAAPASTSGVHPNPNTQKEIVMTKNTLPRPWLDPATAAHLTEDDLNRLDAEYAKWAAEGDRGLGLDLVAYMRDCATDKAKVRQLIGPDEIDVPEWVTVEKRSEWELDDSGLDAVRYLDGIYADVNGLNATLEADQYALSGRIDTRVRINEGEAGDPAELARWGSALIELADRWARIRGEQR